MNDRLIQLIRQHDIDSLSEFLVEYKLQLSAFIDRQLGAALRRKVDIEDVFQELSAEAIRALPGTDLSHREPFSWLCQIAERKIIDLHRFHFQSQKRDAGREVSIHGGGEASQAGGLIQLLVASMTSASQAYSRKAKEDWLSLAIAELPEDQQSALRMRYVEELPSKEIALRLGKSDASVRVMLTRAIKKLQDLLRDQSGAEEQK